MLIYLENIYLCGVNNNDEQFVGVPLFIVICLKISTFVVSTTTIYGYSNPYYKLWFAWKYLPLWYQQQLKPFIDFYNSNCDLLENIYLCGINNNTFMSTYFCPSIVICLKISTFVVSTTTVPPLPAVQSYCDLLENIYLCGINNNRGT